MNPKRLRKPLRDFDLGDLLGFLGLYVVGTGVPEILNQVCRASH
jgi:hypothetical protein